MNQGNQMINDDNLFEDDELFEEEDYQDSTLVDGGNHDWQMLIVDDEEEVHRVTQFVLKKYRYKDRKLKFINAYSGEEAKQILQEHPNVAVILLDVVMEEPDSGLKLVGYIREQIKNPFVQIILRTGQPGYAPEEEVIVKYEINDYKNKTELTDRKLFTVVTTSLRSYSHIMTIEAYRKHLEEKVLERTRELHEKNQKLVELNQEKDEFLGIAAHDLKNPLSAIQGYAQLIRDLFDTLGREEITQLAQDIEQASHRMFSLIRNLLDVNAIESGEMNLDPMKINLNEVSETVVRDYEKRAERKNIAIHLSIPNTKQMIYADPNAITGVFDNLISNAIKYSPKGKNVYVRVIDQQEIVRCEIQDEGPGLGQGDQQKLFKKFSRLTPKPTGKEHSTGLGLYIVKKLVDIMKGVVWCETNLGEGATFIIEFSKVNKSK